jgi:hypothetical protein
MEKDRKTFACCLILITGLFLTGCSVGQVFGPTFTSTPTATSTATTTPTFTPTPASTSTPTCTPTLSTVTILGEEYTAIASPSGDTSPDELAASSGVAQVGRHYIYTTIDDQIYLVDTYNGERDMVRQNGAWTKVEDAGIKFGYLLQKGDENQLKGNRYKLLFPSVAPAEDVKLLGGIIQRDLYMRWTGNTKIVNIKDSAYMDNYPNGINYLALQVVARVGTVANGKDVSFWVAVGRDQNSGQPAIVNMDENTIGNTKVFTVNDYFFSALGSPGQNQLDMDLIINPTFITTSKQYNYICGQLNSELGNGSDAWSDEESCRVQLDQYKTLESLIQKIDDGTITQDELDQMGFMPTVKPILIKSTP